ncbi:MAG: biotin--[acetyl-CoA-carboxylase] ligase [Pseudomonadota bacterium]|nr:biotin--[acetyl-CoA-carboxylase] ligase [Pseudomonadota bacterium]
MAVWADMQTAGKGRRGRNWSSPIGNMYVSLLLRPQCELSRAAQISLVAALGLGDAISQFVAPERITNKWPNDVLIDGKKVAGLLLESSSSGAGETSWVIVGCGVNISSFPDLADYATTCLIDAAARSVPLDVFLPCFLDCFDKRYSSWLKSGIAETREFWLKRAHHIGREITVRLPTEEKRGIFEGLDMDGALILALPNGQRELVTAGDVFAAA